MGWATEYTPFLGSDKLGVAEAAVVAEFFFELFEFGSYGAEGLAAGVLAKHFVGALQSGVGFFELADGMARAVGVKMR